MTIHDDLIGLEHLLDTAPPDQPQPSVPPDNATEGTFKARVVDRRVNLLERIQNGVPPINYLPASHGMLVRGKRHQIVAPKKTGKSFAMLVHWVDMAQAGAIIIILDRENGADLYAQRLQLVLQARHLTPPEQEEVNALIGYFEFPRLTHHDHDELVTAFGHADIVVFDSQRMFLSDLGLEENSSDDYAKFAAAALDPLFRNGIATLVLDNSGHDDTKRSRGSSSKGDLNEVLFSLRQAEGFDQDTEGRVVLTVEDSRFGNRGSWEMRIGAGVFDPWKAEANQTLPDGKKYLTGYMQRISVHLALQPAPLSKNAIASGLGANRNYVFRAVDDLYQLGFIKADTQGRYTHYKSYQEGDEHQVVSVVSGGIEPVSIPVRGERGTGGIGGIAPRRGDHPIPGTAPGEPDSPPADTEPDTTTNGSVGLNLGTASLDELLDAFREDDT